MKFRESNDPLNTLIANFFLLQYLRCLIVAYISAIYGKCCENTELRKLCFNKCFLIFFLTIVIIGSFRYINIRCGHGLNLQDGGHILVWYSMIWSLELYLQTNGRLHRQGQREVVTIHHIVCKDTVDEDVIEALKNKNTTQQSLINAVKARIK